MAHVTIEQFEFTSVDRTTAIQVRVWVSDAIAHGTQPRAAIQLIHGMGEHIARYDHFATYLANLGFLVFGHDAIGHGKSASQEQGYGILPLKDPVTYLVDDTHKLRRIMQDALAQRFDAPIPYLMFGHSFGSLVLRCYLPKYGEGLSGAIVCGTTMPNKLLSKAGNLIARAFVKLKGPYATSSFIHHASYGVYSSKIPNHKTPFDWISSDPHAVAAFIEDEAAGFKFTGTIYIALTEGAYRAAQKASFENIPKDLPILMIAGYEDPVGANGLQVEHVANKMRDAGVESVTTKLYGHMRHEILNEIGKEEVYSDIVSWIDLVLTLPSGEIGAPDSGSPDSGSPESGAPDALTPDQSDLVSTGDTPA